MRRFTVERFTEIEAFRPQVLIGGTADLHALANSCDAGILDLGSIDTVVLVATELGESAMTDIERVMFWQTFGVPVYELLVSSEGDLIASECEAHAGWHLEPRIQRRRRHFQIGRLETEPCLCGRAEPRILVQNDPQLVRVLAAIA
jgi:hypothetical protein